MIRKRGYDPKRLVEPKGNEPMYDLDPIWPSLSSIAYRKPGEPEEKRLWPPWRVPSPVKGAGSNMPQLVMKPTTKRSKGRVNGSAGD